MSDETNPGVSASKCKCCNNFTCSIRTAIVDNQDLKIHTPYVKYMQYCKDGVGDNLLLVICWQYNRDAVAADRFISILIRTWLLVSARNTYSLYFWQQSMIVSSPSFWGKFLTERAR